MLTKLKTTHVGVSHGSCYHDGCSRAYVAFGLGSTILKMAFTIGVGRPRRMFGVDRDRTAHPTMVQRSSRCDGCYHTRPTVLVLTFNQALDATLAQNRANHRIKGPGKHVIRFKSADYDATTLTVTLRPRERISIHKTYKLTVDGSSARERLGNIPSSHAKSLRHWASSGRSRIISRVSAIASSTFVSDFHDAYAGTELLRIDRKSRSLE